MIAVHALPAEGQQQKRQDQKGLGEVAWDFFAKLISVDVDVIKGFISGNDESFERWPFMMICP